MKAAILEAFGRPLQVADVADPVAGSGDVVVDVVATPVGAYAREVFSGARAYPLEPPVVPGFGAVGRVRAVGPDATRLRVGDWVYCDGTLRSRDGGQEPDIALQGWSARGDGGLRLSRYFHDGTFAERLRLPAENTIPVGDVAPHDENSWATVGMYLVPYGGLLTARVEAGETVVVSGATGTFGGAAVAVALAMGAGCVVAVGRNGTVLADLVRRFGDRVRPVAATGDEETDRRAIAAAPGRPIDCVFDILPPSASATQSRAALMTVRPYGRVVLMGGVGMLGGPDLALPYPWLMRNCITLHGRWMYDVDAPLRMIRMIRAGLIDLHQWSIDAFPLDRVNDATEHAAANAGPFRMTVLRP